MLQFIYREGGRSLRTMEIKESSKVERVYDVGVAGMEGALASVVAGLAKVPVIAVPTSIGYGAGYIANQINKLAIK